MRGVFLDIDSLSPGDLDTGEFLGLPVEWTLHPRTGQDECGARLAGADIAVCNKVRIDAAVMASAPALKLICVTATGTNNIDLDKARELGINVCNAPGYATPSVVEHVFALLLTLVRRLDTYRRSVSRGDWSRSTQFCVFDDPIEELAGRTLGIIGYGELGRAVARIAEAFGMRVLLCQRPGGDPAPGRWPLERLLPVVDVLSLHCPLTDATRDLIGEAQFGLMKPGALLLNTARGGIVNESALLAALRSGRLAGAALDVLAEEPPSPDQALIRANLPNLIITPHVAWASRPARQRLLDVTTANIRAFLRQKPINRVD